MSKEPVADGFQKTSFPVMEAGTSQVLPFSGTSASGSPFQDESTIVRLFCTQDCFIAFGAAPIASTGGMFLPGGITEYLGITPGQTIAAVQSVSGGNLYLTEGL